MISLYVYGAEQVQSIRVQCMGFCRKSTCLRVKQNFKKRSLTPFRLFCDKSSKNSAPHFSDPCKFYSALFVLQPKFQPLGTTDLNSVMVPNPKFCESETIKKSLFPTTMGLIHCCELGRKIIKIPVVCAYYDPVPVPVIYIRSKKISIWVPAWFYIFSENDIFPSPLSNFMFSPISRHAGCKI
jgi:hypothetical protein